MAGAIAPDAWAQGVSAVAEEGYRDQADDPQRGELPAAVRVGEEEPGRSVHRDNGAKQNRNQGDGGDAAIEASDQSDAADHLSQHVQVSQSRGGKPRLAKYCTVPAGPNTNSFSAAWARKRPPRATRRRVAARGAVRMSIIGMLQAL
jgi:hypothetical protein